MVRTTITPNGETVLRITGYIIENSDKRLYDFLGYDSATPYEVTAALNQLDGEDIVVKLDGPGGDMMTASTMRSDLMDYSGSIEYHIPGLCASAYTVISTASVKQGCICKMSPTAMFYMHLAQGGANGSYFDMEEASEILKTATNTIVPVYVQKTSLPEQKVLDLLVGENRNGTWLNAQKALELGFIDEILYSDEEPEDQPVPIVALQAVAKGYQNILNQVMPGQLKSVEALRASGAYKEEEEKLSDSIVIQETDMEHFANLIAENLNNRFSSQLHNADPEQPPTTPKNQLSLEQAKLEIEKQRFGGMTV